jgi:hypothetical protein
VTPRSTLRLLWKPPKTYKHFAETAKAGAIAADSGGMISRAITDPRCTAL